MDDKTVTKGQLLEEISTLRSLLSDLRRHESEWKQAERAVQQAGSLLTSILVYSSQDIFCVFIYFSIFFIGFFIGGFPIMKRTSYPTLVI
jgi:hypothetical protein